MKPYDPDDAVELADRLHDVIRQLPPDTHPHTIMTALCAMLARGISLLEPQERGGAMPWAMETIRIGIEARN